MQQAVLDSKHRAAEISISVLDKKIDSIAPALNVCSFLSADSSIRVIAEIKRASPSKGNLADINNPIEHAINYQIGGADAISVLTEPHKFKGSLRDLEQVKNSVNIPVLRKDFISNEYQILEARAHGADFILLIAAALDYKKINDLKNFAASFGMESLIETHSVEEIRIAQDIGANLVGVNARDLKTFDLDKNLFANLVDYIPANAIKIAESAVLSIEDVKKYREDGADAVLVGEALVKNDPISMIRSFKEI